METIMGWAVGYDDTWQRDIGYGVPAKCDHPQCDKNIDRGLAYVCCGQRPRGGEEGCGLYFCGEHFVHKNGEVAKCARCNRDSPPFDPKPDVAEWIKHKMTDETWQQWRDENPGEVAKIKKQTTES
jgi:hypothetical protein